MNAPFPRTLAAAALILIAGTASSSAQTEQEMLEMAMAQQNQQASGISSIAETFRKVMTFGMSRKVVDKIEERDRKQDPFGMAMDPEKDIPEPVAEATEDLEEDQPQAPRSSLQEALSKFQVTGIFPSRQEIIVGAQNLGVGDGVVIDYQGVAFDLVILRVTQNEIAMRDTETGEEAAVQLGFGNRIPDGMHRRKPQPTPESEARESDTIVPMSRRVVKVD